MKKNLTFIGGVKKLPFRSLLLPRPLPLWNKKEIQMWEKHSHGGGIGSRWDYLFKIKNRQK